MVRSRYNIKFNYKWILVQFTEAKTSAQETLKSNKSAAASSFSTGIFLERKWASSNKKCFTVHFSPSFSFVCSVFAMCIVWDFLLLVLLPPSTLPSIKF